MGRTLQGSIGRLSSLEGKALLAVSGGVDSMTLAAACHDAGIDFAVAHCNFSLRGSESDADEALVRAWCESRGVECHVEHFETAAYAASKGQSIEMAARELRYGFFARLCALKGYVAVVVAHNANDNAETVILNMLRGSGLKGLCGMSDDSRAVWDGVPVRIIRPMLEVPRSIIEEYARENEVPFREDSTNSDTAFKRNKIRHEVIPLLQEINPSLLDTFSANAAHLREAGAILDEWFSEVSGEVVCGFAGGEILALSVPRLMASKHQRYILHRLLSPYGFGEGSLAGLAQWLESGEHLSGKRFYGGEYVLVTSSDKLILYRESGSFSVEVPGAGEYLCGSVRVRVSVEPVTEGFSFVQPLGTVILDASRVPFPLTLRSWREGDWMRPLGMGGRRKKLSDIFTGLKMPLSSKQQAVVLEYPGDPSRAAAVVGLRIDGSLKVKSLTQNVIRLTIL